MTTYRDVPERRNKKMQREFASEGEGLPVRAPGSACSKDGEASVSDAVERTMRV